MRQRTLISAVIGLVALVAAVFLARFVARQVQAQIVTAPVVVAKTTIPSYTLITAAMLTVRDLPRAVLTAPIYRTPEELVGLVARMEIVADTPIFKSYAVTAEAARFSADAAAVAVALKVDTARAVGGLVTPGQRVDVWRIAKANPGARDLDPLTLLALKGAEVELVAADLRVLSLTTSQAGQLTTPAGLGAAVPAPAANPAANNISIVTVEASQELAPVLVRLMGEQGPVYDLWLTLAPLTRTITATLSLDKAALLAALTPVPTTALPAPVVAAITPPAPTPTPLPPAVTTKANLNLREGPGMDYALLTQVAISTTLEPVARDESKQWLLVCCAAKSGSAVRDQLGWLVADLVNLTGITVERLPLRAAPPKVTPAPTARSATDATGMDFRGQVEYRNEPGDRRLNYVRARVVTADGTGLGVGLTLAWPGGAVNCPGDLALKPDGWCEFTATQGEFTLTMAGRGQPVTIVLPQNDQHTVATAVFRRLW